MLLTGILGQAGHALAHGATADARAWTAAMQAESAWLGGTEAPASASVALFGGSHHGGDGNAPHSHDGPDGHGPDGHGSDHAHGVAFLAPQGVIVGAPLLTGTLAWALSPARTASDSAGPDRPPRAG